MARVGRYTAKEDTWDQGFWKVELAVQMDEGMC